MADTATAHAETKPTKFGREHYSPGLYRLDLKNALNLPVKMNGELSTFKVAYAKLVKSNIIEMPQPFSFPADEYVTDEGPIQVEAEWTIRSEMRMLLDLVRRDIDPFSVMWFYYSRDWSRDCDEIHIFFAVYKDKVVLEACSFGSEEPLILELDKRDDPVWHSEPDFDEALVTYWYTKFYTETMTGKLMVLRPDEPILYYYQRPTTKDVMKDIAFVISVKSYKLSWMAVVLLVAIAFPVTNVVMGIVAVILFVDLLWRIWLTRNVGQ